MKRGHYFPETADAVEEITDTFDLLWPTAAAIWNLRWQVRGFMDTCPDATEAMLRARFVEGSRVHGTNIKRFCITKSWDEQQANLAKGLLLSLFAIYESWCSRIVDRLSPAKGETYVKGLQFPTTQELNANGSPKLDGSNNPVFKGIEPSLGALTTPQSPYLVLNIVPGLRLAKKYPTGGMCHAELFIRIYRYFKEVRNCIIHEGARASKKAVDAYLDVAGVTAADLGFKESPALNPLVLGDPVELNLRGTVGLSEVLIRLLTFLDAELAASQAAEAVLVEKWKRQHGIGLNFPSPGPKRQARVNRCFKALQFPMPSDAEATVHFLRSKGVAF